MWRFLVDEGLPRSTAAVLRGAGYTADDVRDVGLRGSSDDEVFAHAQARGAAIVTQDTDFANALRFAPHDSFGIIVIRMPNNVPPRLVNAELLRALAQVEAEELGGLLIIVEVGRVRLYHPGTAP